jgi:hypothetical protein
LNALTVSDTCTSTHPPITHARARPQVDAGRGAKDKGNAAYKAGKLERAARLYTRAIDIVGEADYGGADKEATADVKAAVGVWC